VIVAVLMGPQKYAWACKSSGWGQLGSIDLTGSVKREGCHCLGLRQMRVTVECRKLDYQKALNDPAERSAGRLLVDPQWLP
jgi:hypothetical protein